MTMSNVDVNKLNGGQGKLSCHGSKAVMLLQPSSAEGVFIFVEKLPKILNILH